MKLDTEFVKLPLLFDADRLREEIAGFAEDEWLGHATGFSGNTSIPLISLDGEYNDAMVGPMQATPALARCEYIQQIMASFDEVFSRSRLMRLAPGADVPPHVDINYHWYNRVRVHIPITTTEDVLFYCDDRHVHMRAGECWIFNSWMEHTVKNGSDRTRVHLVLDLAGSPRFWNLVDNGEKPFAKTRSPGSEARFVEYRPGMETRIRTEIFNAPLVQGPGELEKLILDLSGDIACSNEAERTGAEQFRRYGRDFIRAWREVWSEHGMRPSGWPAYDLLRKSVYSAVRKITPELKLASNEADVSEALRYLVLGSAINQEFAPQYLDRDLVPANLQKAARRFTRKDETFTAGRNDPCPCGSGARFKHCHGRIA
jgi:Aspartyl/Asparaginyl beta-hydroxylase/SEC-C motif